MKKITWILFFILSSISFAAEDLLDQRDIEIKSLRYGDVIALTAENLKDVLAEYKIALGPGFSLIKPLKVSGTQSNPNLTTVVRKCVVFVCRNVEFDADVTIDEVEGECLENYYLKADLQRSGQLLTDVYDNFYTKICVNPSAQGAKVLLTSYATRARNYNGGPVASIIKEFLELQITPIMTALKTKLDANIRVIDGN